MARVSDERSSFQIHDRAKHGLWDRLKVAEGVVFAGCRGKAGLADLGSSHFSPVSMIGSGKGMQQAKLLRTDDGLSAAADAQLAVDVGDVALDGGPTDHELVCDLLVL